MFQTFSGNSKRARQVNLSGQNTNPFAAAGWGGSASGTRQTVANAQQERQQRQQERDRANAAKRIQRTWRGHKSREELANARRQAWDEADGEPEASDPTELVVKQAQLIVAFFNRRHEEDIERLLVLCRMVSKYGHERFIKIPIIQSCVLRLASITIDALQRYTPLAHSNVLVRANIPSLLPDSSSELLQFLVVLVDGYPKCFPAISRVYYDFLSTLCSNPKQVNLDTSLVLSAIRAPLIQNIDHSTGKI